MNANTPCSTFTKEVRWKITLDKRKPRPETYSLPLAFPLQLPLSVAKIVP